MAASPEPGGPDRKGMERSIPFQELRLKGRPDRPLATNSLSGPIPNPRLSDAGVQLWLLRGMQSEMSRHWPGKKKKRFRHHLISETMLRTDCGSGDARLLATVDRNRQGWINSQMGY